MSDQLVKLAYDLCAIPSISYEEQAVVEFLSAWLTGAGLKVESIAVPGRSGRANIFAYAEERPVYTAIFCTHLDTVAPFIKPHIDNDILWGRGSCDAKGVAASMIRALLDEKAAGFNDLALLFTVGEEESSDGAKEANKKLKGRAQHVVVGEPTELKAAYAQKGSLVFDLLAVGKEAHSAMPHLGDSAINKLLDTLHRFIHEPWPVDAHFKETFINIGEIKGGSMRNMLAKVASARAIMRTSEPAASLCKKLHSLLSKDVTLEVLSSCDPFSYVVPGGFETFLAGFGSDAPYMQAIGKPLLIGPGSLSLAHREDEHMLIKDLRAGVEAYRKIAADLRLF